MFFHSTTFRRAAGSTEERLKNWLELTSHNFDTIDNDINNAFDFRLFSLPFTPFPAADQIRDETTAASLSVKEFIIQVAKETHESPYFDDFFSF